MITFKQFLNEAEQDLVAILRRDCAPFLKQVGKGNFLYRGLSSSRGEEQEAELGGKEVKYLQIVPRTDRKPRSSSQLEHDTIDQWFEDNFGWRARSSGVFAFANHTSYIYGKQHVIFPVGDFKFVYSKKITDLYGELPFSASKDPQKINDFLDGAAYTNHDLADAFSEKVEVMVQCSSYYAIPRTHEAELKELLW